jgi:hypothetical protein
MKPFPVACLDVKGRDLVVGEAELFGHIEILKPGEGDFVQVDCVRLKRWHGNHGPKKAHVDDGGDANSQAYGQNGGP